MNQLYRLLGISKQAVHQQARKQKTFDQKVMDLMLEVDELRSQHPGCGVEKMYYTLKPDFMGRDRFIETFMDLDYRVKKIKNYHRTTLPVSLKYPNLIEGMTVTKKNMLWQSDITYYDIKGKFYYLFFIIDVYTRCIVGYAVSESLRAEANIRALKMAVKEHGYPMIHHSDRGSQYIEKRYTKMLTDNACSISMGLKAQENAYAERINGIIKNEYLKYKEIKNLDQLRKEVKKAVNHYNNIRPHYSLPEKVSPIHYDKGQRGQQKLEIYAKEKPKVVESTFNNFENIKENNLICFIN